MKFGDSNCPKIVVLGFAFLFAVYFGVSAGISIFNSEAQGDITRTEIDGKMSVSFYRTNMSFKNLATLLAGENVRFDEAKLLPNRADASSIIRVKLETPATSAAESEFSEAKPETSVIQLVDSKNSAALTRQRNFELAPTQILIVSLNADRQLLWWDLQPDPRLFRAETSDADGVLSGKTLYRNDVEMLVNVPAAKGITELAFYSPVWDGENYTLKLIGNLNVPVGE
jgi:hypothetical protein